jgi:digeranylgeranylglycerophospholipid reductase
MDNLSSEKCEVCIIGGNIAGANLAYLLSQEKIDVIVVEEHSETGIPLHCAGIISQKLSRIIDLDTSLILNRVKKAILVSPNNLELEMNGKEEPYVLNRVGLDQSQYKRAKNSGARFYFNEKFKTYRKVKGNVKDTSNSGVIIFTDKHKISAKIIVGCDGPSSRIAELNGVKHNLIYGMQVRAKYNCSNNLTKMYFDPRWKELFGWVIPEANGICRIGMGCISSPAKNFNAFLESLQVSKENIVNKQGGWIPWGYIRRIAFDRTLLLGDAGCMVKATTGGGVVMLLIAAKTAKNAIKKAIETNNFTEKFLIHNYEKPLKKEIGVDLKLHYIIRLLLTRFSTEDYNRLFELYNNSKELQKIIDRYADMDFPKRLVVKLVFNKDIVRFIFGMMRKNLNIIPELLDILIGKYKFKRFDKSPTSEAS